MRSQCLPRGTPSLRGRALLRRGRTAVELDGARSCSFCKVRPSVRARRRERGRVVHSTLELELRTSNELEVRPEPVESVRGWCPRGGSIPPSDLRHHDSTLRPAPLPLLSSRFVSLVFSFRPLYRGFSATHTHNHDPLSSVERTHSRHATMKPRHDDRPAVIGRQQRRWLLCHDSTPVAQDRRRRPVATAIERG